ncbi:MAG: CPBP family intramembrane metalloprotease [Ruminococcus sp.]|uniref:CPBP family intramembrane glutamic endopeptidase n=1 Tax=Ruminococcus sp. TaxID=41978 RepID=UPI0025EA0ACA|nr:CPBP family intramembrane glutamic endopeptidase [Ruminococcus sp.]MCR5600526.1 CPBP family intramembrane metalloprotease [Ruminococcus sp.]
MLDHRPKMFEEASKTHTSKNLFVIILSFAAVLIIILVLESIVPGIVTTKPMLEEMQKQGYLDGTQKLSLKDSIAIATKVSAIPKVMIPSLLSTIFGTVTALFYCRFIEMRPVRSMGARKRKLIPHYMLGLAIGIALMTAITLLSVAFGANSISVCSGVNYKIIALFFIGFFVQGMSEEFIFRGYFMTSIGGSGQHTLVAVGISAVGFALAHAANPGFGPVPFINLTLFGVFAALYMILFDDIWGVCAIHSIWNFTQGNFYGISVSGTGDTESVLKTTAVSSKDFLTGGKFGIEGSIFTTVVLVIGTGILIYFLSHKKPQNAA